MFLRCATIIWLLAYLQISTASTIQQDLGSNAAQWKFYSQNKTLTGVAKVPGGIFSDLKNAKILKEDFFFRYNDIEYRWVSWDNWTYHTTFKVSEEMQNKEHINLIFDGINTVAKVFLNGHQLCACKNLFTKYIFPVTRLLKKDGSGNELLVAFQSTPAYAAQQHAINPTAPLILPEEFEGESHANQVRTMQASFGWDWGPALPSQGIWKNVYLEGYESVTIRDVTYHINLVNSTWNVTSNVFIKKLKSSSAYFSVEVTLIGNKGKVFKSANDVIVDSSATNEKIVTQITIPNDEVSLWWPNGINQSQPLYNITVRLLSEKDTILSDRTNKIGFRTIRIIQDLVTPDTPKNGRFFYFEVNGKPIFAKGSNFIPAHTMPELGTNPNVTEHLLRSSAEANHNMLRVWGGGVYETDFFYQLCDELGIMVWQDFMFANGLYPADEAFNDEVRNEVTQTVRRLQHHPCIALWAGNNENEGAVHDSWWGKGEKIYENYRQLYGHLIRDIVMREDPLRPYLPSSPTNGIRTEEEDFLSLTLTPWSELYGDRHYYLNGEVSVLDSRSYTVARFVSEFGFQSMPFLRVWKKNTIESDLFGGLESDFVKIRQHSRGGNEKLYGQTAHLFIYPDREFEFKISKFGEFIFLSQINQAIGTRVEAEKHRRHRNSFNAVNGHGFTMGSMYWQLNDIWAAPSWGGIDCEGTWKMMHYHMAEVYAPVAISTDLNRRELIPENLKICAMNDLFFDLNDLQIEAKLSVWENFEPVVVKKLKIDKLVNSSAIQIFNGSLEGFFEKEEISYNKSFCTFQLQDLSGKALTGLQILPIQPYRNVNFSHSPNLKIVSVRTATSNEFPKRYVAVFDVKIAAEKPAAFVWLDTGEVRGRFSDNGFIFAQPERTVQFLALQHLSVQELKKSLTIKSLYDAMKP